MRSALPLLIAGGSLALLPLLAPATTVVPGGRDRAAACLMRQDSPVAAARDWMGSLKGWPDSAMVLAWRRSLAAAKGKTLTTGCNAGEP